MACKFSTNSVSNIDQHFQVAMDELKNFEGQFNGDINAGDFTLSVLGGNFKGSFKKIRNRIDWNIESKPFFIPCSVIENFLRNHLS